jgi:outer membrane lipoprotein-sorting protein
MVRALRHYFNVDALSETSYVPLPTGLRRPGQKQPREIPAWKLVLTLKPERAKEMREQKGNKLVKGDLEQTWTFWVDKEQGLPRRMQVELGDKQTYVFDFGEFHNNIGISDKVFRIPVGRDIRVIEK